jgi:hypothetical protein
MNVNLIWRAVAYTAGHEEVHVFVEAPDCGTAQERFYERLSEEWSVARGGIDLYNVWNETELRGMANGPQEPEGLPLLESGGGNGQVFYDREPLILIASPRLRAVPESALREVP